MASPQFQPPLTLQGQWVRLVPLRSEHRAELARLGADPDIWTYMRTRPAEGESGMGAFIDALLQEQATGRILAFTQQLVDGDRLVGMTRYLDIAREDSAVEIGGTWIDPAVRRTPVNTEAKRLLLAHAFEVEGVHRVQLKTDLRNLRSQRAIERLGAQREGVLREHLRMPDGALRSSVVYSILAQDWPGVRDQLDVRLRQPWVGPFPRSR